MKAKEFIIVEAKKNSSIGSKVKTRNPVAKNLGVTTSGAGAHRDKKRDAKLGVEKHKKTIPEVVEAYDGDPDEYFVLRHETQFDKDREITMPAAWTKVKQVDSYQEAKRAYEAMKAKYPKDRFTITTHRKRVGEGVAEGSLEEYGNTARGQKMLTKVHKRAVDRVIKADDKNRLEPDYTKRDLKTVRKNQATADRAWDRMSDLDEQGVAEAERNEMDTPEFQRALASVKKSAAQGPKKTVYDPKTGKYKVVPVNSQGKKNG